MTAALEGGEWSASRPCRTLPTGKTWYSLYRRLGGPQDRSGRAEYPVPTGIRSRTVKPVVSRYTDWATGPTFIILQSGKLQNNYPHRVWIQFDISRKTNLVTVVSLSVSAIFCYSRKIWSNLAHRSCWYSADIKKEDEKQRVLKSKTRKELIAAFLHGYIIGLMNYSTLQFFNISQNSLNNAVE